MSAVVTYAAGTDPAANGAALAFLFDAAGIPARPARDRELPVVVHGDGPIADGGLRIPHRPDDRLWPELAAGRVVPADVRDTLPLDIVSLVRAHLEDTVNDAGTEGNDEYGRLRADASFAVAHGIADTPIVNRAVELACGIGAARFGIEPLAAWPEGRRAAVGLSHDVDLPERYAMGFHAARPWRFRRAPRTQATAAYRLLRERIIDREPDDHWAFGRLLAIEERAGVRSTFLFAVTSYHGRWGSTLDVAYDAASRRFRRLYRQLATGGWEIGLHAGYRAHEEPLRFGAERRRLAELAGTEVRGLRHHYWNLGPDVSATLRAHEAAGFAYDASIAFNDAPGYRRGVALPFHPYDELAERPLRTLQLPTTLMDGNLFYRPITLDAALEAAAKQVDTVRAVGGLAVIDWHSHTSVATNRRFRSWGEAYERILADVAASPDLWVTSLGAIADWRLERSARLRRAAEAG